jgi:hypothetical protein
MLLWEIVNRMHCTFNIYILILYLVAKEYKAFECQTTWISNEVKLGLFVLLTLFTNSCPMLVLLWKPLALPTELPLSKRHATLGMI